MKIEENCKECGNDVFEHDSVRAEYHCTTCGCIVEAQLDNDVVQFMNSEGQIEREIGGNTHGSDPRKTWASTRDVNGRPVNMSTQARLRSGRFDRNSRTERTWLRNDVERFIETNMPGSGQMKNLAKKILSQTHSTEEHQKRMAHPILWKVMKDVNDGKHVPLPLNQSRHAQKTSDNDTRNGNYTTRMVAIAVMNIAARIMGINLPTKKLASDLDVIHDHVINESKNICKYLTIVSKAEKILIEQGNLNITRMGIPIIKSQTRMWGETDIRDAMDDLRPEFEMLFGNMIAREMITEIWAMIEEGRGHTHLSGQNVRLVAAGLTVRSTQARGKSRLKQRIANWLKVTPNRLKRLESDFSFVMDEIFKNHHSRQDR